MIDASQLAAKLRHWAGEFAMVSQAEVAVPPGLYPFLASRLVELGVAAEDPDVVTITDAFSGSRKVRLTGKRGNMLAWEPVDGSRGMGLIQLRDVHDADRGKVTTLLEK